MEFEAKWFVLFVLSALTQEEEAMQSPCQMKNTTAKEIFGLCKIPNMTEQISQSNAFSQAQETKWSAKPLSNFPV